MAERPRKPLFPNPFYVVVLLSSTVFVVTALAYLVSAIGFDSVPARKAAGPGPGSRAMAAWLDRHGQLALAVEFAVMFVFTLLAMATDHWFSPKTKGSGT